MVITSIEFGAVVSALFFVVLLCIASEVSRIKARKYYLKKIDLLKAEMCMCSPAVKKASAPEEDWYLATDS